MPWNCKAVVLTGYLYFCQIFGPVLVYLFVPLRRYLLHHVAQNGIISEFLLQERITTLNKVLQILSRFLRRKLKWESYLIWNCECFLSLHQIQGKKRNSIIFSVVHGRLKPLFLNTLFQLIDNFLGTCWVRSYPQGWLPFGSTKAPSIYIRSKCSVSTTSVCRNDFVTRCLSPKKCLFWTNVLVTACC